MKIAISCKDKSLEAEVDARFGRALYFCIYDTDIDSHIFIDNQQTLNSPAGAGIQAAQNVVNAGVSALLTGHCGPKAFRAMSAADVKVYSNVSGLLKDAIVAFKNNQLVEASKADVEDHWL